MGGQTGKCEAGRTGRPQQTSNSKVTFEVPSSRYPRPGAKRGADSSTRVAVLLKPVLNWAYVCSRT